MLRVKSSPRAQDSAFAFFSAAKGTNEQIIVLSDVHVIEGEVKGGHLVDIFSCELIFPQVDCEILPSSREPVGAASV